MSQKPNEAAIEAAARAIVNQPWEDLLPWEHAMARSVAKEALTSALPHLLVEDASATVAMVDHCLRTMDGSQKITDAAIALSTRAMKGWLMDIALVLVAGTACGIVIGYILASLK
jgi:hypothetical protein